MRESIEKYFLNIAKIVSTRTTCPRRAVGCVVVDKYKHILATGFNGVPMNFPHCTEYPCGGESCKSGEELDKCMAIHAEQNALLQCFDVMKIDTIYCTISPCEPCSKLIGNTSCNKVVYFEEYTNNSGIQMLEKLKIKSELYNDTI